MGHQRIGTLPRTLPWQKVLTHLELHPSESAAIASVTITACERRLRHLANEEAIPYCIWLMIRLTQAARFASFVEDAHQVGIVIQEGEPGIAFVAGLADAVFDRLTALPGHGVFGELAIESLQQTLYVTVGATGTDLFGSTIDALRRQLRTLSTKAGFGELAALYFGDFIARALRYFIDRELGTTVGPDMGLATVAEAQTCMADILRHARETTEIMAQFAADWYSLHNFEAQREVTLDETQRFVAHALTKICDELKIEAEAA
jgi:hypothetical protein